MGARSWGLDELEGGKGAYGLHWCGFVVRWRCVLRFTLAFQRESIL